LFEDEAVEIACRTVYLIEQNCIQLSTDSLNFPIDFNVDIIFFDPNSVSLPQPYPEECISSNQDLYKFDIKIYPNPASDQLFIDHLIWGEFIQLYNVAGEQLINQQINSINTSFNISHLADGLHVIRIIDNKKEFNKRILIQR